MKSHSPASNYSKSQQPGFSLVLTDDITSPRSRLLSTHEPWCKPAFLWLLLIFLFTYIHTLLLVGTAASASPELVPDYSALLCLSEHFVNSIYMAPLETLWTKLYPAHRSNSSLFETINVSDDMLWGRASSQMLTFKKKKKSAKMFCGRDKRGRENAISTHSECFACFSWCAPSIIRKAKGHQSEPEAPLFIHAGESSDHKHDEL